MKFRHEKHDIFIPDGADPDIALKRVTHLGIVSHQDDLEIAAYHGITECFKVDDKWFGGVVVTNGAGSPRKGPYAHYTDEEMQRVRLIEQRKAAYVGEYSYMAQLSYPSDDVKEHRRADGRPPFENIAAIRRGAAAKPGEIQGLAPRWPATASQLTL